MARPAVPLVRLLRRDIQDPNAKDRKFLGGLLRDEMLALLSGVQSEGGEFWAALYELNDPELIPALSALGKKCHLVLGSGAFKSGEPDENAAVRARLKSEKRIDLHDRLVGSPHFAHNKFVVFAGKDGVPNRVWTGSTNWTVTGLCTQVNNGILIENAELAAAYRKRWDALVAADAGYPPSLAQQGSVPAHVSIGTSAVTAWNVPCVGLVDLADARKLIKGARQGVLFLFFNPGPAGALLNDVLALKADKLFVHGDEFRFNMVMIHSKVVVVDPFGPHPVVMTGSHNLGPKASGKNDDNLVIIENAPGLAAEYAVNVLGIYGHFKSRHNAVQAAKAGAGQRAGAKTTAWKGLQDGDTWQDEFLSGEKKKELDFWFGKLGAGPG